MEFIVAEKTGPHGRLVIVTDPDLIGKRFEQGKLQLDLSRKFYQGAKTTTEEVISLLKGAQHVHLTGKAAVALGIELDLIESNKIIYIQNIPHAEMVLG